MKESVYKNYDELSLFLNWAYRYPVLTNSCTNQTFRCCVWAAAWWYPRSSSFNG